MSERVPRPHRSEAAIGNFEGNVRMPQDYFAIAVFAAERCLRSEDPSSALAKLLDPIPLDDDLNERTKKANAQHTHHNIQRKLFPGDVRDIQADGNWYALNILLNTVGSESEYETPGIKFTKEGVWATETETNSLHAVQEYVRDERHLSFLRQLYSTAANALKDSEGSAILRQRTTLLADWSSLSEDDMHDRLKVLVEVNLGIYRHIKEVLEAFAASDLNEEERAAVVRFMKTIEEAIASFIKQSKTYS